MSLDSNADPPTLSRSHLAQQLLGMGAGTLATAMEAAASVAELTAPPAAEATSPAPAPTTKRISDLFPALAILPLATTLRGDAWQGLCHGPGLPVWSGQRRQVGRPAAVLRASGLIIRPKKSPEAGRAVLGRWRLRWGGGSRGPETGA